MDTIIWVSQAGNYWLQVTNSCGTTSDTGTVIQKPNLTAVTLPNTLTPNGDGVNDDYTIMELMDAENFRLDIYNRWGRQVFTSTDFTHVWHGEGDGGTVTAGTYFVVLTFLNCYQEEHQINGIISVFP
jgi:gliding motility-associated-like protein